MMDSKQAVWFGGATVLVIGVALIGHEYATSSISPGPLENVLSDREKLAITVTLDLSKTFMSWTVALIGAAAFFIKETTEKPGSLSKLAILSLFGIMLACIISIYFAQRAVDYTGQLLSVKQDPLQSDMLHIFLRYQYVSGLGSLGGFAVFLFHRAWSLANPPTGGAGAAGIVVFFVAVYCMYPADAAEIMLDAQGSNLKSRVISVNGLFAGLVGDTIRMPDGSHRVSIPGDYGNDLTFEVTVTGPRVTIKGTSVDPSCYTGPAWDATGWAVKVGSDGRGITTRLLLQAPSYVHGHGISRQCAALSIGCTKRAMQLEIRSVPKSADIWINGEKVRGKTDQIMSVPFCDGQESTRVVVRMDGRIPCAREIALAAGGSSAVDCDLPQPRGSRP